MLSVGFAGKSTHKSFPRQENVAGKNIQSTEKKRPSRLGKFKLRLRLYKRRLRLYKRRLRFYKRKVRFYKLRLRLNFPSNFGKFS